MDGRKSVPPVTPSKVDLGTAEDSLLPLPVREPSSLPDVRATAIVAAEEVYSANVPLLRWIARKKFRIPGQDVEELVNDVFATYFANAPNVRASRPYLVGAICNASRQYWRRHDAAEAVTTISDRSFAKVEKEGLVDTVNNKLLIATTLARLGRRCRELLYRHYIEGDTTESLAKGRGTTANNICQQLHQCRKDAREVVRSLLKDS